MRAAETDGPPVTLPFALHVLLFALMRAQAARAGNAERASVMFGQGVRLARRLPAGELVRRLVEETRAPHAGWRGDRRPCH